MSANDRVTTGLRATGWVTFAGALAALVLPGAAGRTLAAVLLGVLVGLPLLLVGLAAYGWARQQRAGLASLAAALIAVIALSGLLAAIT